MKQTLANEACEGSGMSNDAGSFRASPKQSLVFSWQIQCAIRSRHIPNSPVDSKVRENRFLASSLATLLLRRKRSSATCIVTRPKLFRESRTMLPSFAPPGKARSRSRHVALLKFGIFHSEISGPCCLVAKFRFDDSEFEPARDCCRFSPFVDTPHVRGENPPFPRPDFPLMSLPFVGLAGNRTPAR